MPRSHRATHRPRDAEIQRSCPWQRESYCGWDTSVQGRWYRLPESYGSAPQVLSEAQWADLFPLPVLFPRLSKSGPPCVPRRSSKNLPDAERLDFVLAFASALVETGRTLRSTQACHFYRAKQAS